MSDKRKTKTKPKPPVEKPTAIPAKSFNFYVNITTSKLLAYAIFIVGSAYSFIFKDSNVLIATFAAASAVMAAKSYTASRERIREMDSGGYGYEEEIDDDRRRRRHDDDDSQQQQQQQQTNIIIISSDDNSEKLEVQPRELNTLVNSGYVEKVKGRYTFKRDKKEQIVSLIDGPELKEQGVYSEEETAI